MKKAILTLMMILLPMAYVWAGKPARIERLAKQYKQHDGVEVLSLGPVGLKLIKGAATLSGDLDQDDKKALNAFGGVKRVLIIDFEDAASSVKTRFLADLERIFSGMELILETKDDEDLVRIYGKEEKGMLEDCILYSSDGAVLCVRGRIGLEQLMELK